MDGISAAASVAGIAAVGVKLSKTLYEVVSTISAGKQEISEIAENVSLLAIVLEGLEEVLAHEKLHFRPALEENAQTIVSRCGSIFKDIEKHTGDAKFKTASKLAWYFKRVRVKPLRASLESLKSTLNILLQVIQLAKTIQETVDSPADYSENWSIRKDRRTLVGQILENRLGVARLKILEEEAFHEKLEFNIGGLPFVYDETSPLPDVFNRKPKVERGFEFAGPTKCDLPSNSAGEEDENRRSRPWERSNIQATSRSHSHEDQRKSRSKDVSKNRHRENLSGPQRRVRSASPYGHMSEKRTASQPPSSASRSISQPATSALISEVIPHEKADKDLHFPESFPESERLEFKAESTANTLLKRWTNVPSYTYSGLHQQPSVKANNVYGEQKHNKSKHAQPLANSKSPASVHRTKASESVRAKAPSSMVAEPESEESLNDDEEDRGQSQADSFVDLDPERGSSRGKDPPDRRARHKPRKYRRNRRASVERRRPRLAPEALESPYEPEIPEQPKSSSSVAAYDPSAYYRPYSHNYPVPSHQPQPYPVQPHPYQPRPLPAYPLQSQYPYPQYFAPAPRAPSPPPAPKSSRDPDPPPAPKPPPEPITVPPPAPLSSLQSIPLPSSAAASAPGASSVSQPSEVVLRTDDSEHRTLATMERILAFMERPTLEMGAMQAEQRQLKEDLRIKAAVEHSKQQTLDAQEALQNSRPVTLQDCLGRRFIFPIEMCRSWWAMEGLVRRRFTSDDAIGSKVYKKEYDLLSPNGEIILPETWELLIRPGWVVGMRLWSALEDGQGGMGSPNYSNLTTVANTATSLTPSGSLKPPRSHNGASSTASSSSRRKKTSIKSWFSGRRSSRYHNNEDSD